MSQILERQKLSSHNPLVTTPTFTGRHYETGTLSNILQARGDANPMTGKPFDEAFVLGASGGIAFGYFVFEYKGYLPHVALLNRNTFNPFERALDNLGIRRETRETTNADKGEENLARELDMGNMAVVWADSYSLPYFGFESHEMYGMRPLLVVGRDGDGFLAVDGTEKPFPMSREEMAKARGRVKKDRWRTMIVEDVKLDPKRMEGALATAAALFLDKPPAGSPNNFGATGMRFMAKMLIDEKNPKSWAKTFPPGPGLRQALAGSIGQPGIWDWICAWGTDSAADRATYAQFLRDIGRAEAANLFNQAAPLWARVADLAMSDAVPELKSLKVLKQEYDRLWREQGRESDGKRAELREQIDALATSLDDPGKLEPHCQEIQRGISELLLKIVELEEPAFRSLRDLKIVE